MFDITYVLYVFWGFEFVSKLPMDLCLVPAERLCFGRLAEVTPDRLQPEGADPEGAQPAAATRLSGHRGRAPPRPPDALWAVIGSLSTGPATAAR